MADYSTVLDETLALPEGLRFDLACVLLDSTDEKASLREDEWWAAWRPEIERRLEQLRRGEAELIDGDEAMARIREAASRNPSCSP